MPKQKIEIEVDVPDGFEATGEWRDPEHEEPFIDLYGSALSLLHGGAKGQPRIILRKKYIPPAWLKPGTWLYRYEDKWFASDLRPRECASGHYCNIDAIEIRIKPELVSFTPPPVSPYQIPEQK